MTDRPIFPIADMAEPAAAVQVRVSEPRAETAVGATNIFLTLRAKYLVLQSWVILAKKSM